MTKLWTPIYDGSVGNVPPVFPAVVTTLHQSQGMLCADGLVDSALTAVFHNLQYTTILFNRHYYNDTPIDGIFLHECLRFVHSSLIDLEGQLRNKLSECIRLGMMVLFATTFRLPGLYEHPCCKSLANELRLSYAAAKVSIPELQETIDMWLMFVCLISTDDIDELSGWASWNAVVIRGLSWDETRRQLKQVMWIDAIHDELGKKAFEALTTRFRLANVPENDGVVM